jgi:hypothetical protein
MGLATLPPEAVQEFYSNLEMAVQTKSVPPLAFAQQFVERVGPEKTAQLVREVTPDGIIDIVREAGGESSALATRDGYLYVEELWMHARMIADEQLASMAQEPPPQEGMEPPGPPPVGPQMPPMPTPEEMAGEPPLEQPSTPPPDETTA